MDPTTILLILAVLFGLYMAWGIGANDVANAMATSTGAGAITLKQAILIAAVFEFLGAFLAGGEVTSTIRRGIIDASMITDANVLLYGMLAALLAAAVWLTVASRFGWPVSTTHSIVGAIIGFAIAGIGIEAVHLGKVGAIAASWVVSPLMSGTLAFAVVLSVKKLILDRAHPAREARRWVPMYIFATSLVISLVTFTKGLRHVGLDISGSEALLYSLMLAAVATVLGAAVIARRRAALISGGSIGGGGGSIGVGGDAAAIGAGAPGTDASEAESPSASELATIEPTFAVLMVFTACAMAFAHGSNDVANAIGPVAAIVSILQTGEIAQTAPVSVWVLLLGALGIVLGLGTFGFRVMATVGRSITELTPSRGFAAELAAATTVVLASAWGLPISTTHTLVGAVLGVGLARGVGALNLVVIRNILVSWLITLPVGAVLAIVFYFVLRGVFS